jgi:hypothetical protein
MAELQKRIARALIEKQQAELTARTNQEVAIVKAD